MRIRYYQTGRAAEREFDLVGPTQWLKGEQKRLADRTKTSNADGRRYITPREAAALTEGFLHKVANEAYRYFSEGMPGGYRLARHRDVRLIETLPHLGYCSFAAIHMKRKDGRPMVIRLHFANFNSPISTEPGNRFFDLRNANRGAMFFAVVFSSDASGERLEIDRSVHHSGISFITSSPAKALDNAIHLRTGMPASEWRKMAEQDTGGRKAA